METFQTRYPGSTFFKDTWLGSLYQAPDPQSPFQFLIQTFAKERLTAEQSFDLKARLSAFKELDPPLSVTKIIEIDFEGETPYWVSRGISGCFLEEKLQEKWKEPEILDCALDLLRGFAFLHQQNFTFGSLLPASILCTPSTLALQDPQFPCVSLFYQGYFPYKIEKISPKDPPELWNTFLSDGRSDIYRLGLLLIELFQGDRELPPQKAVLSLRIPKALKNILAQMVAPAYLDRYSNVIRVLTDLRSYLEKDFAISPVEEKPFLLNQVLGRKGEQGQLEKYFQEEGQGGGRLFLVEGSAGVGKHSLLKQALNTQVREGRFLYVDAECHPYLGIYGPFRAMLQQILIRPEYEEYRGLFRKLAETFQGRGSTTAVRVFQKKKMKGFRSPYEESLRFRRECGEAFLQLSRLQPLALYFRNMEALDQESFQLLCYLLRNRKAEDKLFFYGTLNPEEESSLSRREWEQLEQDKSLVRLPLYGLDHQDISALIRILLGMLHEAPLEFVRKINESAEGSPFAVLHLILWLVESKNLFLKESFWEIDIEDFDFLELPETLEDVLLQRFQFLPELAQNLLGVLAFHQSPMTLQDLKEVLGESDLACFQSLQRLQTRLWVTSIAPSGTPLYFISETFLRSFIEGFTSRTQKKKLLDALEKRYPERLDFAVIRGLSCVEKPLLYEALTLFLQAQDKIHSTLWGATFFSGISLPEEALEARFSLFESFCQVWNEWEYVLPNQEGLLRQILSEAQKQPTLGTASFYLALAQALLLLKEPEPCLKLIQGATKKGARLADILVAEMKYYFYLEQYEEVLKIGENVCAHLEEEEVSPYLLIGRANRRLASVEKLAYEDSQDNFLTFIEKGQKYQNTYIQVLGFYELAQEALPNRPEEAFSALEEAFQLQPEYFYPYLSVQLKFLYGMSFYLKGLPQEAIRVYQEGTSAALRQGFFEKVIEGFVRLAALYREQGQMQLARSSLEQAEAYLKPELGSTTAAILFHLERARYHLEIYQVEAALDDLEVSKKSWPVSLETAGDLAFLQESEEGQSSLVLGNIPKALQKFHQAVARLNPTKDWLYMALSFLSISAVHLEDRDPQNAMVALSKAESLARLLNIPLVFSRLHYLHGLTAFVKENHFLAKKFFAKALKSLQSAPHFHLHWRVLAARGEVFLLEGQILEARQDLEEAHRFCKEWIHDLPKKEKQSFQKIPAFVQLRKSLKLLEERKPLFSEESLQQVLENVKNKAPVRSSQELERHNQQLRLLLDIAQQLNSEFHLDSLLQLILETLLKTMEAEQGGLLLSEEIPQAPKIAFDRKGKATSPLVLSPELFQEALKQGILVTPLPPQRHIVLVALKAPERPLGIFYLERSEPFQEAKDFPLLEAFASQAAFALENARLYQTLEEKKEELACALIEVEAKNQKLSEIHRSLENKVEAQRLEIREIEHQLAQQQNHLEFKYNYDHIIGTSPKIKALFKILDKVIDSKAPVYIQGESGTGKELVARAIHFNSERKKKRFCAENCAALSDSLLESELFGYTKGAFTGALHDRKGLFELAHQGTLFLDEVGDMSPQMQKKLLRVLQEGEIRRIGGKETIPINVRLMSATHRDLRNLVSEGLFREDLYYRLNVIQIQLPPLRERLEDIPALVQHFLQQFHKENPGKSAVQEISPQALELLKSYSWPGNIRELHNTLMSALALTDSPVLTEEDFQEKIGKTTAPRVAFSSVSEEAYQELLQQELSLEDFLQKFVESSQEYYNDTQLAHILGITRKTLWQKRKSWEK